MQRGRCEDKDFRRELLKNVQETKKPDSSFPCQEREGENEGMRERENERERASERERRPFKGAFIEEVCSGFSGNWEGRCYKVIGVSVKCKNKVAVT